MCKHCAYMSAYQRAHNYGTQPHTPHHNRLTALFRDHPGEPMPEENFWTLWCKGNLTEADTQTIRLGATPSGLSSAHLHHPPHFLQTGCPSCRPTNSAKALVHNTVFTILMLSTGEQVICHLIKKTF